LIDPALPAITTATPPLHHSTGHDRSEFRIAWNQPAGKKPVDEIEGEHARVSA